MKLLPLLMAALVGVTVAHAKVAINAPHEKDWHPPVKQLTPPGWHAHKGKRATCGTPTAFTAAQIQDGVATHNAYRAMEAAADMLAVTWNNDAASMAQLWANQCTFAHSMTTDCSGNGLGQNLFLASDPAGYPAINWTAVVLTWYSEKSAGSYNLQTGACGPSGCGHYTQLVRDISGQIGCGYAKCPLITANNVPFPNSVLVVCNYSPQGNDGTIPIYVSGPACSKCDNAGIGAAYLCTTNGLCSPCTPSSDTTGKCKCGTPKQACVNGGVFSSATCSCQCPKGFYGTWCDKACSCADVQSASTCQGWKSYCTNPAYAQFMSDNCHATCAMACNLPAACSA